MYGDFKCIMIHRKSFRLAYFQTKPFADDHGRHPFPPMPRLCTSQSHRPKPSWTCSVASMEEMIGPPATDSWVFVPRTANTCSTRDLRANMFQPKKKWGTWHFGTFGKLLVWSIPSGWKSLPHERNPLESAKPLKARELDQWLLWVLAASSDYGSQ